MIKKLEPGLYDFCVFGDRIRFIVTEAFDEPIQVVGDGGVLTPVYGKKIWANYPNRISHVDEHDILFSIPVMMFE